MLAELASLRDDVNVLTAIVQRLDNSQRPNATHEACPLWTGCIGPSAARPQRPIPKRIATSRSQPAR
jgi:hypothetical protein